MTSHAGPGRRFRTAIHDFEITRIAEDAISFLCRQFLDDAQTFHVAERLVDRGVRETGLLHEGSRFGDGMLHERSMNLKG